MPWKCPECNSLVVMDMLCACPDCLGIRPSWSSGSWVLVEADRHPHLLRGNGVTPTPRLEWGKRILTDSACVVQWPFVRRLADVGLVPPSQWLLLARISSHGGNTFGLKVSVAYARAEVREEQVPLADQAPDEGGWLEVPLLFVYGEPGALGRKTLAEIHVVDLSERTPLGHAPRIEIAVVGRTPFVLPVRAVA